MCLHEQEGGHASAPASVLDPRVEPEYRRRGNIMPIHRVAQGECFCSIAEARGFADARTVYDAPENRTLREVRPNPSWAERVDGGIWRSGLYFVGYKRYESERPFSLDEPHWFDGQAWAALREADEERQRRRRQLPGASITPGETPT